MHTPLGRPVEPEVKLTYASSSAVALGGGFSRLSRERFFQLESRQSTSGFVPAAALEVANGKSFMMANSFSEVSKTGAPMSSCMEARRSLGQVASRKT